MPRGALVLFAGLCLAASVAAQGTSGESSLQPVAPAGEAPFPGSEAVAPAGATPPPGSLRVHIGTIQGARFRPQDVAAFDEDGRPVEAAEGTVSSRRMVAEERLKMAQEILPVAQERVQTARERLSMAQERGDAERLKMAQERLETAEKRLRLAEERLNTALERAQIALQLPVRLEPGQNLTRFRDASTGIELNQSNLTIPVRSGDRVTAQIEANVLEVAGRGDAAEALVEGLRMETEPYEANLSGEKPGVGRVQAKLDIALKDLPEEAELEMAPVASLPEGQKEALEKEASRQGLQVTEVAYSMKVQHRNLTPVMERANLTLTAPRKWVEEHGGPKNVRIIHEADNGTAEFLPTTFLSMGKEERPGPLTEDNQVFRGSTSGFSVFSLVAVEGAAASPVPPPSPTPRQPGMEAALAIGGLLAAAIASAGRPRPR